MPRKKNVLSSGALEEVLKPELKPAQEVKLLGMSKDNKGKGYLMVLTYDAANGLVVGSPEIEPQEGVGTLFTQFKMKAVRLFGDF
jgi:hypothetical protein